MQPEVVFNMDLANGRTGARFCYEAAAVLNEGIGDDDWKILTNETEGFFDIVDEWTNRLEDAGYAVLWDAGDVVVWDLRMFSDDESESFYSELGGF